MLVIEHRSILGRMVEYKMLSVGHNRDTWLHKVPSFLYRSLIQINISYPRGPAKTQQQKPHSSNSSGNLASTEDENEKDFNLDQDLINWDYLVHPDDDNEWLQGSKFNVTISEHPTAADFPIQTQGLYTISPLYTGSSIPCISYHCWNNFTENPNVKKTYMIRLLFTRLS